MGKFDRFQNGVEMRDGYCWGYNFPWVSCSTQLEGRSTNCFLFRMTFSRICVEKTALEDRDVSLWGGGGGRGERVCSLSTIIK